MKKSIILLALLPCLILTGCNGGVFANYRELHQTQLVQTMGLDKQNGAVSVTVASPATKTREAEAYTGSAPTIIRALSRIHSYPSKQFLFYGHTGNVLLGTHMLDDISECLDFMERSVDMRLDTALFAVRGASAEEAIRKAKVGQNTVTELLTPLSDESLQGAVNHMFTAKEIIGSLTSEGVGLIFAVCLSETEGITKEGDVNIIPDGYAVLKKGRTVGYIENPDCLGVNLLLSLPVSEIIDVEDPKGGLCSLGLISTNCTLTPVWQEGELRTLKFHCTVEANVEQADETLSLDETTTISFLERQLTEFLRGRALRAVELSRRLGTDFLGLRKRISVENPKKFEKIEGKWDELFFSLPVVCTFETSILRTYDIIDASEEEK